MTHTNKIRPAITVTHGIKIRPAITVTHIKKIRPAVTFTHTNRIRPAYTFTHTNRNRPALAIKVMRQPHRPIVVIKRHTQVVSPVVVIKRHTQVVRPTIVIKRHTQVVTPTVVIKRVVRHPVRIVKTQESCVQEDECAPTKITKVTVHTPSRIAIRSHAYTVRHPTTTVIKRHVVIASRPTERPSKIRTRSCHVLIPSTRNAVRSHVTIRSDVEVRRPVHTVVRKRVVYRVKPRFYSRVYRRSGSCRRST